MSMYIINFLEKLDIPTPRISKRIPKNSFEANAKLTSAEKKLLTNDVNLITLEYSLTQQNIQVLAILNDDYNYSAINIISVELSNIKNYKKIAKIINRAIPTANIILFYIDNVEIQLSLIHTQLKRINQVDSSKIVLLDEYMTAWLDNANTSTVVLDFLEDIRYSNMIKFDLKVMYQNLVDKIVALEIATKIGVYSLENIEQKKQTLAQIRELVIQTSNLKKQMKQATNFSDKTDCNIQIQNNRKNIVKMESNLKEMSS